MKTVCLVGRPNTGKSSIFNTLTHETNAITLDEPGITRDRIYGYAKYKDKTFKVIDTGGLEFGRGDFREDILAQATFAIDEADIVLFVVDGRTELNQSDYMVRDILRKSNKKVIVLVNKLDTKDKDDLALGFYELGFPIVIPISAAHKRGFDKLIKILIEDLPNDEDLPDRNIVNFAIIGRPNVGKSSLVNSILNKDRAIVSNIAGTTRDATDTPFKYNGEEYLMVDTAGIRKSGKIYETIERYSLLRTLKAIEKCDVCVLVIDASIGLVEEDKHILGMAIKAGKSIVIAVNKWDLVENKEEKRKYYEQLFHFDMPFASYAKVVYISALTHKKVPDLMPLIKEAYLNHKKEVDEIELNNAINDAYNLRLPPSYKGKRLKIYKVRENSIEPPTFNFYVNDKGLVHFSYQRYLENKIRETFDFTGTPIKITFKNRDED